MYDFSGLQKFTDNYIKENNVKLETHQKNMLKNIVSGKMVYATSSKEPQKSILLEIIRLYLIEQENNK